MKLDGWSAFYVSLGVAALVSVHAGHAGEIVMDAPASSEQRLHENAQDNARRAKAESGRTVRIVLPASAVDGVGEEDMFPQHGDDSLPGGKARNLRNSAKERQSGGAVLPADDMKDVLDFTPETAAHEGVAGNVSKARAYMKSSTSQRIAELPVVSCDNVDNVTGRIGDDSQSGSIITIMIKGKQVKARCK